MRQQLLYAAFVILFAHNVNAQITITTSDIQEQLTIGKQITSFANFTVTTANIGAPGLTSWNFGSLVSEAQFVTESKDKTSSPYATDFPNAQYASYYEGTFAGVFSKTWVYNSLGPDYYTDGTGTMTTPQGLNSIGKITFSPKKTHYKLPLDYNNSWNYSGTQTVATTITIPIIGNQTTTIVQNLSVTYTSDAYGKVTMPDGKVLDALRIKEVSTLTSNQNTSITVIYHIITKTGETISITVKDQNSTSGAVEITAISWTDGTGTSSPATTVNAPTVLTAVAISGKIDLTWTDNSTNEDGFKIERSVGNTGQYAEIGQVAANVKTYTDANIQNGVVYNYRVKGFSGTESSTYSNIAVTIGIITDVAEINTGIPDEYKLNQNYPNPFNPTTKISFTLPSSSIVTLKVFNSIGQEVSVLINENLQPGKYSVDFNASKFSSGIYIYKLTANNFVQIKKMMLVK